MTREQKANLTRWIVGAILIPLASWAFMRYDASKLDVSRYEREQVGANAKLDRVLDVVCEQKPQARACRP